LDQKTLLLAGIVVIVIVAIGAFMAMGGGKTATTAPGAATGKGAASSAPATKTAAKAKGAICVVYDIGGRGDLSFNDMAYLGAKKASKDFGLKLIEVQSRSEQDYLPNLRTLARQKKCTVIIAVGFLMTDAVKKVAPEFPNQLFAIVDGYIPDKPNVLSILFKEHEGSALAGALAAMTAHYLIDKGMDYKAVGVVLGMEIPPLYKFEAGYYWGIRYGEKLYEQHTGKKVKPLKILYTYTGSFNDPAKGKQATEAQLAQGAAVVYNVAGATGLGIFDAVEEFAKREGRTMGPPFAIGVDSDQDWIKPGFILASMMKRVDVGVYKAVQRALEYKEGKISKYGGILLLGLKEGGVGLSRLEDLETFIKLAEESGKLKPEEAKKIYNIVKDMREKIPKWIWDETYNLAKTLIEKPDTSVYGVKWGQIEEFAKNPNPDGIKKIRSELKVG